MAMGLPKFEALKTVLIVAIALVSWGARTSSLSTSYYAESCPGLEATVNSVLQAALMTDGRIGASLLRMHFHDCFVQGCDGSILLVDTPTFTGEQTAKPNINSIRGLNVVDDIKSAVEAICPGTVSCADILALVARDGVISAGGPYWDVEYGRLDSKTACLSCANTQIPGPSSDVAKLTAAFAAKGLDRKDMVTLSGAHTIGKSHCALFSPRLTNYLGTGSPDPTINPAYLPTLQGECPAGVSSTKVVDMDPKTPYVFDNWYYSNIVNNEGLFTSDQTMYSEGGPTANIVGDYAWYQSDFFSQFAKSITKMGQISPITSWWDGEIRYKCSAVN